MILFNSSNYAHIANGLLDLSFLAAGRFTPARYTNGELYIEVLTQVSGEHCLILGSIAPPDEQLLSLPLLANTLRRGGASRITAILPYLAYSRQDKDKAGESMATGWVGSLFRASCISDVITVDVHSERDKALFSVPLTSLSPAQIFANTLKEWQLADATLVAPDNGAISRCEEVQRATGMTAIAIPYFEKRRVPAGFEHAGPFGKVGPRAVLIDDILDTGSTLVAACEKLPPAQVQEIYIMITHGLFTGDVWQKLWSLRVRRIFCTDTVLLPGSFAKEKITVLSVLPLLRQAIISMEDEKILAMAARLD